MGILDWLYNGVAGALASRLIGTAGSGIAKTRDYVRGKQSKQLKVRENQFDDNIVLNFVGLIADRIVSQTVGRGFELDFEGDKETDSEKWIKSLLDANHQEVLFHRAAKFAVEAGTGFMFLQPGGVTGNDSALYPRLTLLEPAFVTIHTEPEDFEQITGYTIQYKLTRNGKEVARKREITKVAAIQGADEPDKISWLISDFEMTGGSNVWTPVGQVDWPHYFPPVLHWQNLPSLDKAEGEPDITDDLLATQDRVNFVASNASKIIRFYAHPQRFSRLLGMDSKVKLAPDEMPNFTDSNGGLFQLEPMGDMAGILSYLRLLRQAMFDRARVIDIDSMQDKVGSLTNFGLKVLYQDNINLINTHRELLGDAIEELVQRLLILGGKEVVPCKVVWPDWMPVNETEEIAAVVQDINAGLLSKQTAAGMRGYDWETEQERLAAEKTAAGNIGASILEAFNQGL
ncbi:MAG: phage portal protein [Saccharofermentanales bacterium]